MLGLLSYGPQDAPWHGDRQGAWHGAWQGGGTERATGQSLRGDDRMLHLSVIIVLHACHLDRAVGNPLLFN